MKKIGITGSLASGKTTASKILSFKNGPLFSADDVVKKLYKNLKFKKIISKKFGFKNLSNLKKKIKDKIQKKEINVKKLEEIIHPLVRKKMKEFEKKNLRKKFIFFEVPLLVESKLMKNFDIIFFIKAKKSIRFKRFQSKGGNKKLFEMLNNKQLNDKLKAKHSNHVVVNEKNIKILKKKLLYILNKYE